MSGRRGRVIEFTRCMFAVATALAPTLILIVAGQVLRRLRFIPAEAWAGIEKLTYFVLFPALLVRNLAVQDLAGVPWRTMLIVLTVTLLAAATALTAWQLWRRPHDGATFTSIFQGGVRFNSYIALALSQAFFGAQGLRVGAVAIGMLIVVINLLSVAAFSLWGERAGGSARAFLRDIATNPLILACLLGWVLSITGAGLPGVTEHVLDLTSRAALPLGLLAVGAVLQPRALGSHFAPIAGASLVQFVLKPVTAVAMIALTGLDGVAAAVLFIAFVTPVAPSAYILARQLGGNTGVMASIVTAQTVLAFVTIPLMVWLFLARF
ncbi:MAG: AEC family transporter [Pseudomonadota bacterium]